MKVLKFGGTSLANAKKFIKIIKIIEYNIKNKKISIILSAPAKITNYLENIIKKYKEKKKFKKYIKNIINILINIIKEISIKQKNFRYKKILKFIQIEYKHLKNIYKKIYLSKKIPKKIYSYIISKGEYFSINIMKELLKSRKHNITIIDPVKKILAIGNYIESIANIKKSTKRINKINITKKNIILMPGFIAGNKNKEMILLGRNGSDYSASILAACLKASCCEIWTDVNGIYTSDPKFIKNSQLLKSLTYQEAIKLAFFGAKVLHQKTIFPILNFKIPCIIKNTLNIKNKGTIISNKKKYKTNTIKGVTYLNNIININIKNKNINKIKKLIKEILKFTKKLSIWIILIPNYTYQNNINMYIKKENKKEIKKFIKKKIKNITLNKKNKNKIIINKNLSIISIIGYNLHNKTKVAMKIFTALQNNNINVIHIIQGNCKYSISLIIKMSNVLIGVKCIHQILFEKKNIIEICIIGMGGVGSTLFKKIHKQKKKLKHQNIKIKIFCITNSKKMLININGIKNKNWYKKLQTSNKIFNLNDIIKTQKKHYLNNPIIIDCTANNEIPKQYFQIINKGFHIITPNKIFNTLNIKHYQKLRKIAKQKNKKFLYKTNVGAGLPIIETLQNIINSGDKIIKCKGILSGSLSYIFGKLNKNTSIFKATKKAIKMGFTEPNPRDDLLGIDFARKLLILAREIGHKLELKDIKIKNILPKKISILNTKIEFMKKLPKLNNYFKNKIKKALKKKKVLRFIGTITSKGKCYIKLKKINKHNPFYKVKNGENALAFYSNYYQPSPLVIKGYGAGNKVTASGIFTDLLKIIS